MDRHSIAADGLAASIAADGAELVSLRHDNGPELIWQAGPVWPRHAPILFPIVGRLRDDTLLHRGRRFRMTQHGFARDRRFTWLERTETGCRLLLTDDEETRAAYPFAFRLEVAYAVGDGTLGVTMTVHNPAAETLPASLGAHPGFAWPLRAELPKDAHSLTFDQPEPAPIRRLAEGLLLPDAAPSPVDGPLLRLREELFTQDALIFDQLASRRVRYTAPGAPSVTLRWENCPQLGVWSKPGDFLCIEPWHGFASPAGFAGEFIDKPGLLHIPHGQTEQASFAIAVGGSSSHD